MTSSLEHRPLSEALGAEVCGLDLARPLPPAQREALFALWDEHLVLLFRDQKLTDAQLIDFSRQFGELDPPGPNPYGKAYLPDHPEINVVANVEINGIPGNLGASELIWHSDLTYVERPPKGAVLYALEVPEASGDTYFANLYLAAETLPPEWRSRIAGRVAIHDATYNSAGLMRKGYAPVTDPRNAPGARHPLLKRHPRTGREHLFLGRRRNSHIVGLELDESAALLDALWEHATKPAITFSHRWRQGDVLVWDNRVTLHRRDAFDPGVRRVMHRTQIRDDA
jgi:taurine dioxygenase